MTDQTCECCGGVETEFPERAVEREHETESPERTVEREHETESPERTVEREHETESESDATTGGEAESTVDRWFGASSVTEATLPHDVRDAMERFVGGDDSITTLEDWIAALRERTGGPIGVDDLCHADGETAHWGELEDDRYHFRCFYDAVALAELASEPVDIRTRSPDGTVIEARATGNGEVTATPSTAVVSFGVATDALPSGAPTLEDAYAAICPSVKAFPTRSDYERWAARTPAATVGVPLSAATAVATGLVED